MDNQQTNNNLSQQQTLTVMPPPAIVDGSIGGWYKATVLRRLIASLVDGFIFFIVAIVLALIGKSVSNPARGYLPALLFWVYSVLCVLFIWRFGATLGKKLLKIQVVNTDYQSVSLWKAFVREVIGKFLSSFVFGLGWLWAFWDKDKQAWHDKIAGTYVVTKIPNNGKNSIWLYIVAGLLILILIVILYIIKEISSQFAAG